jgi:pimeloyl-ACP methyl ester carboxylesterase
MPYIAVRGVNHYYEWFTASEQSQPTGKPVLAFLHGWAGSTRYWQSTARSLVDQFDCLLYDLRGFGQSRLPRPTPSEVTAIGYEMVSYADDLAVLLDALGIDRVFLNAHSTGGSIAVRFLKRYPERVERAILTCNGVFEYDERAFKAFHQFGGYVVKFRLSWLLNLPGVDRLFMARFLHRSLPATLNRAFLEDFLHADYEAALGTVYTAVSQRAAEEMPAVFATLTVPTLLISGEFDRIIPPALGRKAAALNPQITHIVMTKTAHFPMLEDPDRYLQIVKEFLQVPHLVSEPS